MLLLGLGLLLVLGWQSGEVLLYPLLRLMLRLMLVLLPLELRRRGAKVMPLLLLLLGRRGDEVLARLLEGRRPRGGELLPPLLQRRGSKVLACLLKGRVLPLLQEGGRWRGDQQLLPPLLKLVAKRQLLQPQRQRLNRQLLQY